MMAAKSINRTLVIQTEGALSIILKMTIHMMNGGRLKQPTMLSFNVDTCYSQWQVWHVDALR